MEARDRILPEVSDRPGRWVVRSLEKRGARVHLNAELLSARNGHVILSVDGQTVKTIAELHGVLGRKHPGDRLEIRFRRGNAIRKATVTTKAAADNSKQAILGIFLILAVIANRIVLTRASSTRR